MRYRRKGSQSYWKLKCDIEFSKLIRSRGTCEMAGWKLKSCSSQLQCAHIISRKYGITRFDPRNCLALCWAHHRFCHEEPLLFTEWLEENRVEDLIYLRKRRMEVEKISYKELYEKLKL